MFDHKMDNLSRDEQALFAINPTDLPFVFISLDRIKNQVSVKILLDFYKNFFPGGESLLITFNGIQNCFLNYFE